MISRLLLRRAIFSQAITLHSTPHPTSTRPRPFPLPLNPPSQRRHYAAPPTADAILEDLQELYATAKDEVASQPLPPPSPLHLGPISHSKRLPSNPPTDHTPKFEIAHEETTQKTIYAASDRAAAREQLENFKTAFERAVRNSAPDVGAEVQRRVGSRLRELETAVQGMEEKAVEEG